MICFLETPDLWSELSLINLKFCSKLPLKSFLLLVSQLPFHSHHGARVLWMPGVPLQHPSWGGQNGGVRVWGTSCHPFAIDAHSESGTIAERFECGCETKHIHRCLDMPPFIALSLFGPSSVCVYQKFPWVKNEEYWHNMTRDPFHIEHEYWFMYISGPGSCHCQCPQDCWVWNML